MSFHGCLQELRSALAPSRRDRRRRGPLRAAAHRPNLDVLEGRCLLSLSPAASFPAGATPREVATADFNHDGRLDLATANYDGTLGVLLGDGNGGFGTVRRFAVGSMTAGQSLTVADFDNDGHLDLAMLGSVPNSAAVGILAGDGTGAFRPPADAAITALPNGSPLSVAAGDFNADGQADLVCSLRYLISPDNPDDVYDAVELLPGNGRGGFGDPIESRLRGFYPNGLAVADLNADGIPDVVTANYQSGTVSVLLGNLSGPVDFATGPAPLAVTVGDFTGDGIPDLVTVGQGVDIMPGNGDGTFAAPIHRTANGTDMMSVAAADLDGDGNLDVVTSDLVAGTVSVLLGRGDGTLSPPIDHAAGSLPRAVAVGDFNGDGRADVAAADRGTNAVSVLLNDANWPPPGAPSIAVTDAVVAEGHAGTRAITFTVSLSATFGRIVTVGYATADGTATVAGGDYRGLSGTLTFAAGEISKTITVLVNGDRLGEQDETFVVNLGSPTNATIADGRGVATIRDDEPRISIGDVTRAEGKKGQTTLFTFTVTLSAAYDQAVTMSFQTVDGTATASDGDYVAKRGTLTFAPGETSKTVTIVIQGDSKREPDETFYLDLFGNSSNSLFTKKRGVGTIRNDD